MHGFVLWGIALILNDKIGLATILMVMAINFKQMSLYFALPFGVFALAKIYKQNNGWLIGIVLNILALLTIFVLTNLAIWAPFILKGGAVTVNDILYRIFPVRRGIFEGNVATFWCLVHNMIIRVNDWSRPLQLKLTTITTLAMCGPSLLMLYARPSKRNFLYTQVACCLAFYMFSM